MTRIAPATQPDPVAQTFGLSRYLDTHRALPPVLSAADGSADQLVDPLVADRARAYAADMDAASRDTVMASTMADVMVEATAAYGCTTADNLRDAGFTADEISRLAGRAGRITEKRRVRQVDDGRDHIGVTTAMASAALIAELTSGKGMSVTRRTDMAGGIQ